MMRLLRNTSWSLPAKKLNKHISFPILQYVSLHRIGRRYSHRNRIIQGLLTQLTVCSTKVSAKTTDVPAAPGLHDVDTGDFFKVRLVPCVSKSMGQNRGVAEPTDCWWLEIQYICGLASKNQSIPRILNQLLPWSIERPWLFLYMKNKHKGILETTLYPSQRAGLCCCQWKLNHWRKHIHQETAKLFI